MHEWEDIVNRVPECVGERRIVCGRSARWWMMIKDKICRMYEMYKKKEVKEAVRSLHLE